jgi:hypothetical protein
MPETTPSKYPGHPSAFILTAAGVFANWKVAGGILAFFIASGALWTALGLAKVSDLSDHNTNPNAHQIVLEQGAEPVAIGAVVKASVAHQKTRDAKQEELDRRLAGALDIIVTVKNGMYEDRAERLADRVADKETNPRRSREVWKEVRERAIDNQENKRPLRDGLERLAD